MYVSCKLFTFLIAYLSIKWFVYIVWHISVVLSEGWEWFDVVREYKLKTIVSEKLL